LKVSVDPFKPSVTQEPPVSEIELTLEDIRPVTKFCN